MFKNLNIKSKYIIPRDDIAKDFLNPLLKIAVRYDRIAGFFSSKALAYYSEGLEYFSSNSNNKFRLLISHVISEEDYELIKQGYLWRKELEEGLLKNLEQKLTLREEKNLSNLSYLIAKGIVDIKIAFIHRGLFHDKTGILYDSNNNIIHFNGSLNETENGLLNNYETINVLCNWESSEFYLNTINDSINEFELIWNNKHENVFVFYPTNPIFDKLKSFNKNKLIFDEVILKKNTIIFDFFEGDFLIYLNVNNPNLIFNDFYYYDIQPYEREIVENTIYLKKISFDDIEVISNTFNNISRNHNCEYVKSQRLLDFLENKKTQIRERNKIGKYIKNRHEDTLDEFNEYKESLNSLISRKLRDCQVWDSFFMYKMKKSANFSVPGSGKTSSVLGTFAYLDKIGKCNKIVVVSPKNSFGSWIDEFHINFSNIKKLELYNVHDSKYTDTNKKKFDLEYKTSKTNLFLFNYESLPSFIDELSKIVSDRCLLVFDEVHKIKRIEGKYASAALELAKHSGYTIVMTGTPIPNSYCDVYNMLNILFPYDYRDFFNFSVNSLKNPNFLEIENLNNKIYPFFCRTTKNELGVPPPNKDIEIKTEATEIENQIFTILYKALLKEPLVLFIRMLQLESNPKLLLNKISDEMFSDVFDEDYENIHESKMVDFRDDIYELVNKINITSKKEECLKLISNLVKENKHVILWCIFRDTINSFYELLLSKGIKARCVYGEISLEDRQSIVKDFKSGEFQVLITNPHTLAESVSLHNICHDAIYFEYSYNLVHFLQSKDRIHRLGLSVDQYTQLYFMKTNFKTNFNIFCFGDRVYKRLMEKEDIMLKSIENNKLEQLPSMNEDLKLIFQNL